MAVDSVNGNNNTALYTGIGTVAGAGAGIATGYLTRPFLKTVPRQMNFLIRLLMQQ